MDDLRLDTTMRMLKTPHFNAKMNALKEVVRLTEEPYQAAARGVRSPIAAERVTEWLVKEKVLSIALQGEGGRGGEGGREGGREGGGREVGEGGRESVIRERALKMRYVLNVRS